eukprot:COSAG05_NODE_285_length_12188_cov_539.399537_2_plen_92_part_00
MTVHVKLKYSDETTTGLMSRRAAAAQGQAAAAAGSGGNATVWTLASPAGSVQDGANPPGQPNLISPTQSTLAPSDVLVVPAFAYVVVVVQL